MTEVGKGSELAIIKPAELPPKNEAASPPPAGEKVVNKTNERIEELLNASMDRLGEIRRKSMMNKSISPKSERERP